MFRKFYYCVYSFELTSLTVFRKFYSFELASLTVYGEPVHLGSFAFCTKRENSTPLFSNRSQDIYEHNIFSAFAFCLLLRPNKKGCQTRPDGSINSADTHLVRVNSSRAPLILSKR